MDNQRLLLYMALGFISLLIYQAWLQDYHMPAFTPTVETGTAEVDGETVAAAPEGANVNLPTTAGSGPTAVIDSTVVVPEQRRIKIKTDVLDLEVDSQGGTIISARLPYYPVALDQPEVPFTLVTDDPFNYQVIESGLASLDSDRGEPNHNTLLATDASEYIMKDDQGELIVPFKWQSEDGLSVLKELVFTPGSYQIDVRYTINNASETDWPVRQYRQIARKPGTRDKGQQFIYTYSGGVVSNADDRYTKVSLDDMRDENLEVQATNGWVAMIEHYFAAAWAPVDDEPNTAYTRYDNSNNRHVIGLVSGAKTIPAGGQGTFETKAYVGPKIQDELKKTAEHLELTVDYGWLTIIAQPLFWLLKTIHGFVGNWGWAIILTTVVVKAIFYKLSEKGYKSMARMKALQPKLQSLKERYGDDRARMGQETMELYKKEKVNPLGGCLPMLIPIPVFIALYWTLLESVELRQAPWMFWIEDLSIRDPFFILPVIYAATMYFQQKLNPAPLDPIQAKVMQFLPVIFGVFFAFFPAGLVLYWIVNNVLSMAQQYYITKHVIGDGTKPAKA